MQSSLCKASALARFYSLATKFCVICTSVDQPAHDRLGPLLCEPGAYSSKHSLAVTRVGHSCHIEGNTNFVNICQHCRQRSGCKCIVDAAPEARGPWAFTGCHRKALDAQAGDSLASTDQQITACCNDALYTLLCSGASGLQILQRLTYRQLKDMTIYAQAWGLMRHPPSIFEQWMMKPAGLEDFMCKVPVKP